MAYTKCRQCKADVELVCETCVGLLDQVEALQEEVEELRYEYKQEEVEELQTEYKEHEALIERALQAALRLGETCPKAIRDLLFKVHGKVIV